MHIQWILWNCHQICEIHTTIRKHVHLNAGKMFTLLRLRFVRNWWQKFSMQINNKLCLDVSIVAQFSLLIQLIDWLIFFLFCLFIQKYNRIIEKESGNVRRAKRKKEERALHYLTYLHFQIIVFSDAIFEAKPPLFLFVFNAQLNKCKSHKRLYQLYFFFLSFPFFRQQ